MVEASRPARTSRLLWIPGGATLCSLSVLSVCAVVGWPGTFAAAGAGFCEAFREGAIKQPANTWSNLGFVVAGLWVTRRVRVDLANPEPPRNLIGRSTGLSILYATLVVLVGPGSIAMHGSGTAWGGTTDVLSMLAYIALPVAYAAVRVVGGGARAFAWFYIGLVGVLGLSGFPNAETLNLTMSYVDVGLIGHRVQTRKGPV